MTQVTGRVAFITGGANGIGMGIARAFASAGASLALVDVDAQALQAAKNELASRTRVETYIVDVRERDTFVKVAEDISKKLGPVSLVVNNAGVAGGAPAHKLSYEQWDWGLGINLNGVINGVQTFLSDIIKRGAGGHIVNTASGAGLATGSNGVLYHTAKFAVVGMTEALHAELAPLGIGATVLCPGPIATGIIERSRQSLPLAQTPLTDEERSAAEKRSHAMTSWLARGVSPNSVGKMVLDAVEANRLYVHTDRVMYALIEARTQALLAAMPG